MGVEFGPERYGHRLRPVDAADARAILELRMDPELGRYLNPTSGGVDDQRRWIEAQRTREGDYYFVVETATGRWQGVVGLYAIEGGTAEWGRWVLRRGSLAAPASVLLVFEFAFEKCNLQRVYCRTLLDNVVVVNFHDSCPYSTRAEYSDNACRRVVEHSLSCNDWPQFRKKLALVAQRIATRGNQR